MNIFWGMKILWISYWGPHKIGPYSGSFLGILGSFLKVKVQNGGFYFFFLGGGGGGVTAKFDLFIIKVNDQARQMHLPLKCPYSHPIVAFSTATRLKLLMSYYKTNNLFRL